MELTKDQLRALRLAMDAAFTTIAKDHGLAQLRAGNCTFDRSGFFTFKVDGRLNGAPTKEELAYTQYIELYDVGQSLPLPPLHFEFTNAGSRLKVVGMNTTGTKVIAQDLTTSKQFLYKTDAIRQIYQRQKPKAA